MVGDGLFSSGCPGRADFFQAPEWPASFLLDAHACQKESRRVVHGTQKKAGRPVSFLPGPGVTGSFSSWCGSAPRRNVDGHSETWKKARHNGHHRICGGHNNYYAVATAKRWNTVLKMRSWQGQECSPLSTDCQNTWKITSEKVSKPSQSNNVLYLISWRLSFLAIFTVLKRNFHSSSIYILIIIMTAINN